MLAMLSLAGAASAGPWEYNSVKDPVTGKAKPMKAVTLDERPGWATDYEWKWTYMLDTYAMEKNVVDNPARETKTLGGFGFGKEMRTQAAAVGGSVADVFSDFSTGLSGGSVSVWGYGGPGAAPANSSGTSGSELQMRWVAKDAKNKVKLSTGWKVGRTGGQSTEAPATIRDPIDLRIFDLERNEWLFDSVLWQADCDVQDGGAVLESGTFTTLGTGPGSLIINAGHALMGGTGSIELRWDHGVITSALDDGIFDGLLPAIGSSALLPLFHIGDAEGNLFFDVDLGAETSAGYRWEMGLGIEGSGAEAIVPTPAGSLALSTLGLWASRRRR